jgi:hypothetical protein
MPGMHKDCVGHSIRSASASSLLVVATIQWSLVRPRGITAVLVKPLKATTAYELAFGLDSIHDGLPVSVSALEA